MAVELKDKPGIDKETGEYSVIAPGQRFVSVTEKITRIVLDANDPAGLVCDLRHWRRAGDYAAGGRDLAFFEGRGDLGDHAAGGLGFCDYQLCLVDRHWPRWHADLRNFIALQARMA